MQIYINILVAYQYHEIIFKLCVWHHNMCIHIYIPKIILLLSGVLHIFINHYIHFDVILDALDYIQMKC